MNVSAFYAGLRNVKATQSLLLDTILNQLYSSRILTTHFPKIDLNFILPPLSQYSKRFLCQQFCMHILFPHASYMLNLNNCLYFLANKTL